MLFKVGFPKLDAIMDFFKWNHWNQIATQQLLLSLRPVRHYQRRRWVSHRQHSIKLCTFAYKFISKIHHLNGIASSSPLLYTAAHRKKRTLQLSVLLYPLSPYSRAFRTLIDKHTTRKCCHGLSQLGTGDASIEEQKPGQLVVLNTRI